MVSPGPLRAEHNGESVVSRFIVNGACRIQGLISSRIDRSYIKGSGIGRETATAFATAGAKRLVLIGRTAFTLARTKDLVQENSSGTVCLIFPIDITNDKAMHQIAADIGVWDIFILNASHIPNPTSVASANLPDYWSAYEVYFPIVLDYTS